MGREIRRVPSGWEHPRDELGHYQPLYDEDYDTALTHWLSEWQQWCQGGEDRQKAERYWAEQGKGSREQVAQEPGYWFKQWHGGPPNASNYRRRWSTEPACYQVYENVSEGTPTSPVFDSLEQLTDWLVTRGYSRHAAEAFARSGYVPSFAIIGGHFADGIAAADLLPKGPS